MHLALNRCRCLLDNITFIPSLCVRWWCCFGNCCRPWPSRICIWCSGSGRDTPTCVRLSSVTAERANRHHCFFVILLCQLAWWMASMEFICNTRRIHPIFPLRSPVHPRPSFLLSTGPIGRVRSPPAHITHLGWIRLARARAHLLQPADATAVHERCRGAWQITLRASELWWISIRLGGQTDKRYYLFKNQFIIYLSKRCKVFIVLFRWLALNAVSLALNAVFVMYTYSSIFIPKMLFFEPLQHQYRPFWPVFFERKYIEWSIHTCLECF